MKTKHKKQKNLHLHLILLAKGTSGSSGKHATVRSKSQTKKLLKHLIKKGFYD